MPVVLVTQVAIAEGSTIGHGWGITDDGTVEVQFVGDHRPMRYIGEAIAEGHMVLVDVPEHAVVAVREVPQSD